MRQLAGGMSAVVVVVVDINVLFWFYMDNTWLQTNLVKLNDFSCPIFYLINVMVSYSSRALLLLMKFSMYKLL